MNLFHTVAVAVAGAALFELLRVPAGALIGAFVAVALLNVYGPDAAAAMPPGARFAAFAVLGWAIGLSVTRETLSTLRADIWSMALIVGALILVGGIVAVVLTQLGVLDGTTAFLASSPGGLSQMAALSNALDADQPYVTTAHVVRVVVVIMSAPIVARIVEAA